MPDPSPPPDPPPQFARRGAVAIVVRQERLLVIRRSDGVIAPGAFCFPGGGLEDDESEPEALARELREELHAVIRPIRCLWRCVTSWGVSLAWWLCDLESDAPLVPNPAEVESILWCTPEEMARLPGLLPSNRDFLKALEDGRFDLAG
jgi:8-oxo-dGTP pyrophosphatase MutT (NUDIX family)